LRGNVYFIRQLIHADKVEQGRKKIQRETKLPRRLTSLFLACTRTRSQTLRFRWMPATSPRWPLAARERTSHVTRRFPATNAASASTPRKSAICWRRRWTVSTCPSIRWSTIYPIIYTHEPRREVGSVVRPW